VTPNSIELAVREAVCEALALDEDEVTSEATLTDELGAESIDLLDVLFRIERSTGGRLEAQRVIDLFSVQNLTDLVTQRAALAST